MRLSKRLTDCVAFARFATEHDVTPHGLAELLTLAARAFSAGERECNTDKPADPARERFEKAAAALGFGVEWNGLAPTLMRDGRSVYLPAF